MNLIATFEKIMMSLSTLPGLQFLGGYVIEMRSRKTSREQMISRYSSYVQTVRGVATDVTGAVGGPKQRPAGKPQKELRSEETEVIEDEYEEEDDDLETFGF